MTQERAQHHRVIERSVQMPEAIDRWEVTGGTWRIASVGKDLALVDLLRCDGGEVVDRLRLEQPKDVKWAAMQRAGE